MVVVELQTMTLGEFVDCCPEPPPFSDEDPRWVSIRWMWESMGISDTALVEIRQQMGNPFEHRLRHRVFLFFPYWILALKLLREQRGGRRGSPNWSDSW